VFLNPTTGNTTAIYDTALGQSFETLGLAISPDGRIFVAALNLGIYVFSSTGVYLGIVSAPSEDIYAWSMAYTTASNGLLYVVDQFNNRIVTFPVGYQGSPSDAFRTVNSHTSTAVLAIAAILLTLLITV